MDNVDHASGAPGGRAAGAFADDASRACSSCLLLFSSSFLPPSSSEESRRTRFAVNPGPKEREDVLGGVHVTVPGGTTAPLYDGALDTVSTVQYLVDLVVGDRHQL